MMSPHMFKHTFDALYAWDGVFELFSNACYAHALTFYKTALHVERCLIDTTFPSRCPQPHH